MYRFESIDLGSYRGDDYFLVGFVDPDPSHHEEYDPDEDADDYGATLVRSTSHPNEENVEIVRMDTAHGRPHMDRVYLPPDADLERKEWLDEGYTYERMMRYLLVNWKEFVDRYILYND